MPTTKSNANFNVCCVAIMALIFIGALLALKTYFSQEDFGADYQDEIEQIHDEKDMVADKYHYQGVSQSSSAQQSDDYAQTMVEPQNLATDYQNVSQNNELLPIDRVSSEWARANPQGTGSLEMKNMLEAGHLYGVNTQGSSLKNSNQQIRSEPPNPVLPVSIWNNSTVTPDIYRKPLEIGECD